MNEFRISLPKETRNSQLVSPTHVRRRHVLAVLLDRSAATSERELARELAGGVREDQAGDLSRAEAHLRLRHVDLPKLADAGFVAWDESDGTVRPGDHPALDDARFERAIEREADGCDDAAPDVLNERRRTVLAVLETRGGRLERTDLARAVAAREVDGEPSSEDVHEVAVALHHVHLPKLEQAGLLAYDADGGTVTYHG